MLVSNCIEFKKNATDCTNFTKKELVKSMQSEAGFIVASLK
jgi:hypothetical protein